MRGRRGFVVVCGALALGCSDLPLARQEPERVLTLLHTSDIHSRVWPFRSRISNFEAELGLGRAADLEELGGMARLATLLDAERRRGAALWLDSGDALEGAEVFHRYGGRVELQLLSSLGLDAMALGNHELSLSAPDLAELVLASATFPVLAADLEPRAGSPLAGVLAPSAILSAAGLRVGVVGVANRESPPDLASPGNRWQLEAPAAWAAAVQSVIDELSPQVGLIVVLSHLGLDGDRALVAGTTGIDLVLGGHQHIITAAAEYEDDCSSPALQAERGCSPRRVPIVHSGAYSKWLSRLELELAPDLTQLGQLEVSGLTLTHLPVGNRVAADARVAEVLEALGPPPEAPLAFLPAGLPRAAALGGDSPLGDLTADAMRRANAADVALLNSSGLRDDLPAGVLGRAELELAFPFDEPWRLGWLSGRTLRRGLARAARRSAAQHCVSTLQISGLRLKIRCAACAAGRPDCLELERALPFGGEEAFDDELLLVALPAYLTLARADFEEVAAVTSEVSGSVPEALGQYFEALPRVSASDGSSAACVTSLSHGPASSCSAAPARSACPPSLESARATCRELPQVDGGRDERIQIRP